MSNILRLRRCEFCGGRKIQTHYYNYGATFTCKRCQTSVVKNKNDEVIICHLINKENTTVQSIKIYYKSYISTNEKLGMYFYENYEQIMYTNKIEDVHLNNFHKIFNKYTRILILQ